MQSEKSDRIRPFDMKVRCAQCKLEGEISSKDWSVRITGAVEMLCPRCGKKTVYVGVFGHDVDSIRQVADLRRSGLSPDTEKNGERNARR